MSHGSKRWIKDYTGKIKRSNNRTKLDYYGDLRWWNEWRGKKRKFCPQCKHVAKQVVNDSNTYWKVWREVRDEWLAVKGLAWVPWNTKETREYDEYMKEHPRLKNLDRPWHYQDTNYLCFKHERMNDVQDDMWWDNVPGKKKDYNGMVKEERRKYRKTIKNIMNRAKYDEAYYEDIPIRRHGWLD